MSCDVSEGLGPVSTKDGFGICLKINQRKTTANGNDKNTPRTAPPIIEPTKPNTPYFRFFRINPAISGKDPNKNPRVMFAAMM